MRVLEANTVTILPTSKCTAKCRHCSMNSGPEREEQLEWGDLESIINQLYDELKNLEVLCFSGGEATLLGEDLHKAIRLCKQRNPKVVVRLVSNGFWAKSPEAATETLQALKDAGLDELNISTDDYHLPYISLQRIKNAWEAAKTMNFLSIALSNAYGPESWLTPERVDSSFGGEKPMDRRFGEDGFGTQREFSWEKTNVLLSNMPLNRLGNRQDKLATGETQVMGAQLAEVADMMSGCPWAIRSAAVSAKGHLVSCCGFEIEDNPILDYGSIQENGLKNLLDKADNDLISNMIAIIGPPQLKRILERIAPDEIDFPRPDYASYCEVCEDLVGKEKNRAALYKYQALFFDTVSDVRAEYTKRYTYEKNGTIRIPAGSRLTYNFQVADPAQGAKEEDFFMPPRDSSENARLIPLSRLSRGKEPAMMAPSPCRTSR